MNTEQASERLIIALLTGAPGLEGMSIVPRESDEELQVPLIAVSAMHRGEDLAWKSPVDGRFAVQIEIEIEVAVHQGDGNSPARIEEYAAAIDARLANPPVVAEIGLFEMLILHERQDGARQAEGGRRENAIVYPLTAKLLPA